MPSKKANSKVSGGADKKSTITLAEFKFSPEVPNNLIILSKRFDVISSSAKSIADSCAKIANLTSEVDGLTLKSKTELTDFLYSIKNIWAELRGININLPMVDSGDSIAKLASDTFFLLAEELGKINELLVKNSESIGTLLKGKDEKKDKAIN